MAHQPFAEDLVNTRYSDETIAGIDGKLHKCTVVGNMPIPPVGFSALGLVTDRMPLLFDATSTFYCLSLPTTFASTSSSPVFPGYTFSAPSRIRNVSHLPRQRFSTGAWSSMLRAPNTTLAA
eukprot:6214105-Pleurochrysis_carterae.AAC.3